MHTLAICNLKGGVGKTTLTLNLAAALADAGDRVLLIDADAQGSLTECLVTRTPGMPSLAEVLRGQATVATAALPTAINGVWLLASSPHLDRINHRTLAGERVLAARMHHAYDVTLIDCPATTGVVLCNALIVADQVIAPVQARALAQVGLRRLAQQMRQLQARTGSSRLGPAAIVINQFDGATEISNNVAAMLRSQYGSRVLRTVIEESSYISEGLDAHQPVQISAPDSHAADQFRQLASELRKRPRHKAARPRRGQRGAHLKVAHSGKH